MDPVIAVVVLGGALYALREGWRGAKRDFGNAKSNMRAVYRQRVGKRQRVKPGPFGFRVGAGVATGIGVAGIGLRGFAAGCREGWPVGTQRSRDWWDRWAEKRERHPDRVGGNGIPAPVPVPAAAAPAGGEPAVNGNGHPAPDVPPSGWTNPTITVSNENGVGADMTSGSGEVHTMQQLIAELEGMVARAATEVDDASADRSRAEKEMAWVDLIVASLNAQGVTDQTRDAVAGIADPVAAWVKAADARVASADARRAQAGQALVVLRANHQLMQEAVLATENPADLSFYQG